MRCITRPLVATSILCNIILLYTTSCKWLNPTLFVPSLQSHQVPGTMEGPAKLPVKRIAVVSPALMPIIEKIEKGFIDTINLNKKYRYEIRIFNSAGNKTLLHSQVEEIILNSYDLIFTIGASATQLTKEITTKKNKPIPIVFCAISDAVERHIVASEECSQNHVTGASALKVQSYRQGLELLSLLKPEMKKILIPYNPSAFVGGDQVKQIEEICHNRGIQVQRIEVFGINEVIEKTTAFMAHADVLFVIRDSTVMSAMDALVKLCNNYGVTLFTTDTESVKKGAVVGLGLDETESGAHAAQKAQLILEENKKPSEIPITIPNYHYTLQINETALKSQKLPLSDELLFLMKNTEIY